MFLHCTADIMAVYMGSNTFHYEMDLMVVWWVQWLCILDPLCNGYNGRVVDPMVVYVGSIVQWI